MQFMLSLLFGFLISIIGIVGNVLDAPRSSPVPALTGRKPTFAISFNALVTSSDLTSSSSSAGPIDAFPSLNAPATNTPASQSSNAVTTEAASSSQSFSWVPISELPYLFTQKNGQLYLVGTGTVEPTVDVATFDVAINGNGLPIPYARDKNSVYWFTASGNPEDPNNLIVGELYELEAANPTTFSPIFATPVNIRSYQATQARSTNPQCVYDAYGKDSDHVFFQDYVINGADPNTFGILFDSQGCPTNYDTDASHIFYDLDQEGSTTILPNSIDRATFKVLDDFYIEDKNGVYNKYGFLVSESTTTFQVMTAPQVCGSTCFFDAEDSNHKYSFGKAIQ